MEYAMAVEYSAEMAELVLDILAVEGGDLFLNEVCEAPSLRAARQVVSEVKGLAACSEMAQASWYGGDLLPPLRATQSGVYAL